MKRNAVIGVVVIVVLLLAGGAYYLYSNGYKTTPSSTPSTSSNDSSLPDVNNAVLVTKTDSKVGKYLATPAGAPLYTYDSDTSGVSNCTGSCLANWPAYQVAGDTTTLPTGVGLITRSDNGEKQYTFNGMPLYTFTSDGNGQVTGDGVESFHVAKPAEPVSTQASASPSATPSPSPSPSASSQSSYDYPY